MTAHYLKSEYAFIVALTCVSGCGATPPRPAGVPASAVSSGGVFIECSVEEQSRPNRCAVYDGKSGEVEVSGSFLLSGAGRGAVRSELQQLDYSPDSGNITLRGGGILHPVVLWKYPTPGMSERLTALAGKGALDCGRVTLDRKPEAAFSCALAAFRENKPFYVSYDVKGWGPGLTRAYARGSTGDLFYVVYSLTGWPHLKQPQDIHIDVEPCPKPQSLVESSFGELTCFSQIGVE